MSRIRVPFTLLLVSLLAIWVVAGCENTTRSDEAGNIANRPQTVDLDDPYGGFNTADEAPAFGDASLAASFGPEGDVEVHDTIDVGSMDHDRPHRFLMITWGNLDADSLIDFTTDWSGGLCAENAIVVARRLIRFEPRDYLLPRTSRACVEWVSHTRPHFDGIVVELVPPRCDSLTAATEPGLCGQPVSVTFETGPLTVTFDQEDLSDLHRVIPVDEAGNAVAFNTVVVMPGDCPNGFLAGQWLPVEDDHIDGLFRGKWVSESGRHMGYLRGVYGVNRRGENVFFGKWITESGRFRGLLRGRYGVSPDAGAIGDAAGWFEGLWYSRDLAVGGGLGGVWGTDSETDTGFFRGRWHARCR